MKQVITREDVITAINDLVARGKTPTLLALHAALNHRGSMSTLVRLKAEIETATQPANDSAEGLKAFRQVWALAVEDGRKAQEGIIIELRESLKALAAENERLEGTTSAAEKWAVDQEESRLGLAEELEQVKTISAAASAQATAALQKLADAQAAHAAQSAALQAELNAAVNKAHDFELQLARAHALLDPKGIRPTTDKPAKAAPPNKPQSTTSAP